MDGYLALYAGLASFFWGRWLEKGNSLDFISGILLTGVVLDLKNEGALYALIVSGLLLFFVSIPNRESDSRRYLAGLPLVVVGLVSLGKKETAVPAKKRSPTGAGFGG